MSNIWVPTSHRFRGELDARKAASDYDPNLDFGFNENTGQWCVFLKQGTMAAAAEKDLPILGFDHIPSRDEVQKRLYQVDALRRGREVLDDLNRHNQRIRDEREARGRDADGQLAEALEWGFRMKGSSKAPASKVFFTEKQKDK